MVGTTLNTIDDSVQLMPRVPLGGVCPDSVYAVFLRPCFLQQHESTPRSAAATQRRRERCRFVVKCWPALASKHLTCR